MDGVAPREDLLLAIFRFHLDSQRLAPVNLPGTRIGVGLAQRDLDAPGICIPFTKVLKSGSRPASE